jgi:hypothetical protein
VRGDHDDWKEPGRFVLANAPADLVAVHPRHLDVEQDEIRRIGDDSLQGLGA